MVIFLRCEITRPIQSGGTGLYAMIACDFVCQNAVPFLLCLPKMNPVNGVLRVFRPCGLRQVSMKFFFNFVLPWVYWSEEYCMVCIQDLLVLL